MPSVYDLLAHQVATRPDALALEDVTGARLTYADLSTAADEIAEVLKAKGITQGDRVMIVSENCAAKVAALFATWLIRAIAVPVNARQTAAEIARVDAHAEPKAVFFTTQVSPDAAKYSITAQKKIADLDASTISGGWGELTLHCPRGDSFAGDSDVAVLLYTTGTTGDPKGVMLTHDNVRFGGKTSAELRGMTHDDLIYGVLPTTHVFGLCSVVVAAIHAGAPVRLIPRFVVADVFDALRDGITLFSAVPQMHALLMAHAKALGQSSLGSKTLRYVSSGAAPLDPTWKRETEAFYGVAIQNGYGMTESTAGTAATRNVIGDPDTSVGPALPGIEIDIDDEVPGGEVLTRGPHVMKGYFRNPAETAKVLGQDGWLRTGDLGEIDAEGKLHILGRAKELIIHGGFNVFPPEVEAALNDHPDVIQAAVVGRSNGGDEEVLAFVQVPQDGGPSEEDLRAFVRDRLAGYKRPARYVLSTSLPAAPTGKILKHKLIETFANQLD
ncbi:class I adenylate-forming enzyme family protein [Tateyamaria sp. ANG-S1]|uniref:class I adenylate-forming enzyme family protein n=1 Tax=Tateyamaria sp. ANG-S1 TaxID=1577905 RepID=UPI00057E5F5B|nr:class I adenylate-forming enzyme family protein [Tateyamaria sp. ANG-S1]KIC48243.1 long-chain fatty acid--CoA ligase [Tateyamaria sp. ANG-S1]